MTTETEPETPAPVETAVPDSVAEAVTDAQKAEGAEAMRIAKINHPEVNWQADPVTGAPLVPGLAQTESFESVKYAPPEPGDTTGQQGLEGQPAPEPTAKTEAKKADKGDR